MVKEEIVEPFREIRFHFRMNLKVNVKQEFCIVVFGITVSARFGINDFKTLFDEFRKRSRLIAYLIGFRVKPFINSCFDCAVFLFHIDFKQTVFDIDFGTWGSSQNFDFACFVRKQTPIGFVVFRLDLVNDFDV